MPTSRNDPFALYRRLARHASSAWLWIAAPFLVGLFATPLALLTSLALKAAVDRAILEKEVRLIGFRDLAAIATGVSLAEGARR